MQVLKKSQINQLFHPTGELGQDSQEIVYSKDTVNATKFYPILLKEWFYLVKQGGFLVIDYKPNKQSLPLRGKILDFQKLEETMWWLWKGKYNILSHGEEQGKVSLPKLGSGYTRFICQKLVSTKKDGDDINKWTFGIITKGERDDWLEEIIKSIKDQKIPNYEIIICGTYRDRKEKNFKYIPFFERDDRAWITKKKNLIAKEAKYENICIIHDRIVFDKNWFVGMKKYGNCFDVLCNQQTLKDKGIRTGDWLTYGYGKLGSPYGISQLRYNDWDYYIYMGGQLSILKKSIWEVCPWNETLYWGEEDVELSFRFRDLGHLIRFNEYSKCTALAWRFGIIPTKYYFTEGLLPKDMLIRRFLRIVNRILFAVPSIKKLISPVVLKIMHSKIYNLVIHK